MIKCSIHEKLPCSKTTDFRSAQFVLYKIKNKLQVSNTNTDEESLQWILYNNQSIPYWFVLKIMQKYIDTDEIAVYISKSLKQTSSTSENSL